jgi:hypothetical protein
MHRTAGGGASIDLLEDGVLRVSGATCLEATLCDTCGLSGGGGGGGADLEARLTAAMDAQIQAINATLSRAALDQSTDIANLRDAIAVLTARLEQMNATGPGPTSPSPCSTSSEVAYDGSGMSWPDVRQGHSADDVFGSGDNPQWEIGSTSPGQELALGYHFPSPIALSRWDVYQYSRSSTAQDCNRAVEPCDGCAVTRGQFTAHGITVDDFCNDPSGDRLFCYCQDIAIQHSDDGSSWTTARVFPAQIQQNRFDLSESAGAHSYWRMKCESPGIGSTVATSWQTSSSNTVGGVQMYEYACV